VNGGRAKAASRLAPLASAISDEAMRDAYGRARRGESVALETRAPGFASGVSLLPPELFPVPTFPRHENRLLDRLPGYALEAPSLEYIQVNSITGSAAIVGEGQPKPEAQMPATKLICAALKLAIHAGISWENMLDLENFSNAVRTELMRLVVDLDGIMIDTNLMGRVAIRESLALRIGYSGADFTDNVVRTLCEERLNLAVERPAAICRISGLPTVAVSAVEEETTTSKRGSK